MLQKISSVFIVYRRKTLTGSLDPTHANGTNKPCIIGGEPGHIGITCQKEPFHIESLRDTLQGEHNTGPMQEEKLERIPSVKKLVRPADVMPSEGAEYKVCQYCHLWTMYADSSVELKKKSELSQESAVAACKMYVPYISDITRQIEEVVKIFAMEKELRLIKNRGYFLVPQLAPKECKIETI